MAVPDLPASPARLRICPGAVAAGPGSERARAQPVAQHFHPKLYVARHGDEIAAAISSANLTSELVANVEVGAILRGNRSAHPMVRLWELAESWWEHVDAVAWAPEHVVAAPEVLALDLLAAIIAALSTDRVVRTIADGKENWVQDITPDGVWVETTNSRAQRRPAQLVEAWMIQIAWEWLHAHGSITYKFLVADDGLNVKRSSFVCALLARLPDVEIVSRRPIELRLPRPSVE